MLLCFPEAQTISQAHLDGRSSDLEPAVAAATGGHPKSDSRDLGDLLPASTTLTLEDVNANIERF
jgi:hypothetical protein